MRSRDRLSGRSGIVRSTDRGNTWIVSAAGLPGYYLTSYHDLAVEPTNGAIYVGMDDCPLPLSFLPRYLPVNRRRGAMGRLNPCYRAAYRLRRS